MRRPAFPIRWSPRLSSRALLFAAMAPAAWRIGAMLPRFFDVSRDVPVAGGGPNLWTAVRLIPLGDVELAGLAMALGIGTLATLLAQFVLAPPRRDRSVAAALLAALVLPWLLPATGIVEFAPALLLASIDAHRRRTLTIVGWTTIAMALALLTHPAIGAIAIGLAIRYAMRAAIVLPANDNVLPLAPPRLYLPHRPA